MRRAVYIRPHGHQSRSARPISVLKKKIYATSEDRMRPSGGGGAGCARTDEGCFSHPGARMMAAKGAAGGPFDKALRCVTRKGQYDQELAAMNMIPLHLQRLLHQ